jgi:hypothetical protein
MKRFILSTLSVILLFLLASCSSNSSTSSSSSEGTKFTTTTSDGVVLNGTQWGNSSTVLILSNGYGDFASEWTPSPVGKFLSNGYRVITYDYRSTYKDLPEYVTDLQAIIDWAKQHGAKKIALIGASLGGLVSAKAAVHNSVSALITISSLATVDLPKILGGANIGFLELTQEEASAINAPKLITTAENDPYKTYPSALYNMFGAPKQLMVFSGRLHADELFGTEVELIDYIVHFLEFHNIKG